MIIEIFIKRSGSRILEVRQKKDGENKISHQVISIETAVRLMETFSHARIYSGNYLIQFQLKDDTDKALFMLTYM